MPLFLAGRTSFQSCYFGFHFFFFVFLVLVSFLRFSQWGLVEHGVSVLIKPFSPPGPLFFFFQRANKG